MKNAFYFILKALFILKIFKFLSCLFGHVEIYGVNLVLRRHIFQRKCSSCYVLLTDQISLHGCFYFLRYWATCVLELFVNQVVTS